MTTWSDVLSGDVILGADGLVWLVERTQARRARFELSRPGRAPLSGTPAPDTPVRILHRGSTACAVDLLRTTFPGLSIVEES